MYWRRVTREATDPYTIDQALEEGRDDVWPFDSHATDTVKIWRPEHRVGSTLRAAGVALSAGAIIVSGLVEVKYLGNLPMPTLDSFINHLPTGVPSEIPTFLPK
jgi:hypothetical protein